jgi:cell wall-associated NlpC family hydrolase
MRETPDKDGNLLMKLHEGTALEILDKFGDWYEVEYNDVIGYVFEKYVSVNEDGVFSAKSPREGISAVIEFAKEKLGSEYVWGANGPNQFDCSGYVKYVFENAIGVELPRTSYLQSRLDNKLDFSELEKGDLVFFDTSKQGRVNHVGIYLGDGKFIHASSARSKKRVTISELSKFYKNTFKWGVRI